MHLFAEDYTDQFKLGKFIREKDYEVYTKTLEVNF